MLALQYTTSIMRNTRSKFDLVDNLCENLLFTTSGASSDPCIQEESNNLLRYCIKMTAVSYYQNTKTMEDVEK